MILAALVIVFLGLLLLQKEHYAFVRSETKQKEISLVEDALKWKIDQLSLDMKAQMEDIDVFKKRVDALTLRAGFKL